MGSSEATNWLDFFTKLLDQPLHVILVFTNVTFCYGLYALGKLYLKARKDRIRAGLILALHISKGEEISIADAEDKAEQMIVGR